MGLPSVLLHDHLDGGLRPQTVIDLALESGYDGLPSMDPAELGVWFDQSESGSLETYLEAFEHTVAVMQTQPAIERVAYEAAVDLANDGVVYAEIRFRPNHHVLSGLTGEQVIDAVASGMKLGAAETGIEWNLIVDALRQYDDSQQEVRRAMESTGLGVVGFDIAGPERANPPDKHLPSFRLAKESGLRITIHAGEAAGDLATQYLASAIDRCGAERIGHGVEIVRDCTIDDGEIVAVGQVAGRIRDRNIALELCPRSNMATGEIGPSEHPIGMLYRAGFNVTISTDNRLMSATSMSTEFDLVVAHHGFTIQDLARTTWRSLEASFATHDVKRRLWDESIAPRYRDAGADISQEWKFQ